MFAFEMPVGAPIGTAYNVGFEVLEVIMDMAKQAAENAKPKNVEEN